MKQYKLTAWPELPARFQKTTMRRVVSELSQRFVSTRDVARSCGASAREVDDLVEHLNREGLLMSRDAPQTAGSGAGWREWGPLVAMRELVRR